MNNKHVKQYIIQNISHIEDSLFLRQIYTLVKLVPGKKGPEAYRQSRVMWKRVNPNVEYVIAAMRKKGEDIKNGISKVRCPEKGKPAAKEKCHSCIRP